MKEGEMGWGGEERESEGELVRDGCVVCWG